MAHPLKLSLQVVAIAVVAGLLALLVWKITHQPHPVKIGGPAPAFALDRLDGNGTLALASLRGKAVVLNFWASWCGPCKSESKALQQAYMRYRGQGVVVLGVDYHDLVSDARSFVSKHGLTYPIVRDGSGLLADRYDVTGVPETFFIDRRGRLVGTHIEGPVNHPLNGGAEAFPAGIEAALHS